MPSRQLPKNIRAISSLSDAARSATMLIFCLPHQFIPSICQQLKSAKILPKDTIAISLIKGVDVKGDNINIFPDVIQDELGVSCSALSGANIADEGADGQLCLSASRPKADAVSLSLCTVAVGKFSETTVGYRTREEGLLWQKRPSPFLTHGGTQRLTCGLCGRTVFHTPSFHVQIIEDPVGVSLCGALKNVVATAAGFCDGLGWGNNAKGASKPVSACAQFR